MRTQLLPSFLLTGAISVLISQPVFAQVREVTGIQLNSTDNSIEVILETPAAWGAFHCNWLSFSAALSC